MLPTIRARHRSAQLVGSARQSPPITWRAFAFFRFPVGSLFHYDTMNRLAMAST